MHLRLGVLLTALSGLPDVTNANSKAAHVAASLADDNVILFGGLASNAMYMQATPEFINRVKRLGYWCNPPVDKPEKVMWTIKWSTWRRRCLEAMLDVPINEWGRAEEGDVKYVPMYGPLEPLDYHIIALPKAGADRNDPNIKQFASSVYNSAIRFSQRLKQFRDIIARLRHMGSRKAWICSGFRMIGACPHWICTCRGFSRT